MDTKNRRVACILCFAFIAIMSFAQSAMSRELVVYTALETDELTMYLDDFREKHSDVAIKVVRDSTGIITARLLAEQDNPQADVVWGLALTSLMVGDQKGLFAPYSPKGIERIRPSFIDSENDIPHWVGIKGWMSVLVGNRIELAKQGLPMPESFEDLLNPAYRNQIVMPNPASSGTGFLTVSAMLQAFGEEMGWQYLDHLHRNVAFYAHSGSRPGRLAGAGEFLVGISFGFRAFKQQERGEPVLVTFPKEGSGWDIEANALVRKPRINPDAKRFLDWAINEDVMKMYVKNYAIIGFKSLDSPRPDGYPKDIESQLIQNDFTWAAKNRERIIREWSARYESSPHEK